ncbi:phosphatase PAP2 family protein [Streptomyces sp. NRRL B-24484]|uniref:phosphatase PAP2 family protein n=1 Tax=Streptomyces sp. NRRL B-24484 TaxID=1463833 RepID=UPI0006949884|nr:phosphatase PAP2 family protein [Streptomyces sp. NRRL B-24484]
MSGIGRGGPAAGKAAPATGVAGVAWAGFAALAVLLAGHGRAPFGFEQDAVDWAVAHRPPAARAAALALTSLGTGVFPYLLALAAGAVTLRDAPGPRSRARTVLLLAAPVLWLIAGQLLRQGFMHAFGRPRPPAADWATAAAGFAFPSGHAFTSAVSAGLLALAVARTGPAAARTAAAIAAVFAAAIGLSRIYIGVHWPLDVLGGWLLATGWLAAAVALRGRWGAVPKPRPAPTEPGDGDGAGSVHARGRS